MRTGLAIAVLVGTWSSAVTIAWAGSYPDGGLVVYLPAGATTGPPTTTWITYAKLRGPWYTFVEAW